MPDTLWRDYFKIVRPTEDEVAEWEDAKKASPKSKKALRVTLEATHSGFVNDNLRFYIPSRMRDGAPSFIEGSKPAKVLKHHNAYGDPVGIVIDAEYVPTVPDSLSSSESVQILLDSNFSIKEQLRATGRFIKTGMPTNSDFKGLGYKYSQDP